MVELAQEEKELLESYENDEWQSVENLEKEKVRYRQVARNTFLKNKRINIRLAERDLNGLKQKSFEEGIPYQTLIASVLHKYVSGKLVERNK